MRIEMLGQSQLLQASERPTILVVDDEEIIRDLCVRALPDYRVFEAENGQVALEFLEGENVDLLLVDVMMPVMNGLDLLKQIEAVHERHHHVGQDQVDRLVLEQIEGGAAVIGLDDAVIG